LLQSLIMSKKVLICCFEIPGFGGASTSHYGLFELLQKDGLDVSYLNIISSEDEDYFKYTFGNSFGNPKSLNNVYNCVVKGNLYDFHPELVELAKKLNPDIIMGVGFIAAHLMKRSVPDKKLIFFCCGCDQVNQYIKEGIVRDAISLTKFLQKSKRPPVILNNKEKEAVEASDYIITHSETINFFYNSFYPFSKGKISPDIIWSACWKYKNVLQYLNLKKPFEARDIDVIFVASIWNRREKNLDMVRKIVSKLKGLNIHIVGEIDKPIFGATCHGLVTEREKLFSLLGRSKTIVSTSVFDPVPGVLFEASAMDCNIIASKNCGNWKICHEALLANPFVLANVLNKIKLSLDHKYKDNMDYFLETDSYQKLKDIFQVF